FLSDVGGPTQLVTATNLALTFDDAAAGTVPAVVTLPSGTYRPTNTNDGLGADTFSAPAPMPSSQATLAGAFTGIDPNGTWNLYVVDDATGDTGSIAGGWSLTLTTEVAATSTVTAVTSSGSPSTTGDPVTFTATVSSGGSAVTAGAVQFSDGATALGSAVALNGSGQATITMSALAEGSHQIVATYGGATGFLASNGSLAQRVDNPTVATGNTFCNTGTVTPPMVGTAQPYPSHILVSGLSGEVSKVTATLKGVSHSAPIDLDIMLAGPTASKNLLLMSDAGGQDPVGNADLTFDDDAAGPLPVPAVSGTYRPTRVDDESVENFPAPAPALSAATALSTFDGTAPNGTWSLYVVDDATGDSGSIAGGWCLTVTTPAPTSTSLTSSTNPSIVDASVTFTATVTSGGSPVSSGVVQFSNDGSPLGAPVPVAADGTVTLTTASLDVGPHTVAAAYVGTESFGESSGSLTQVVIKAPTTTALTSATNPSTSGQSVTFTATVTSGGLAVTSGSVAFTDGGSALGAPVPVAADGTATLTTAGLGAGTHAITATYGGDTTHASSSDDLEQVVDKVMTSTTLTSDANPVVVGEAVTFTATVTASGSPVTSGAVQFGSDGTELGSPVPVAADGTATVTTSSLAVGSHPVTANYLGTATYAESSEAVTQTVTPHDPSITAEVASGQPKTRHGWYRTAVTVTFSCTPNGAPLTAPCPTPVRLTHDGAGQSVTRSIASTDGGAASVTVRGINIDRTDPVVKVRGVRAGKQYFGNAPSASCHARDRLSGIAECTLHEKRHGDRVIYVGKARDKAGNTAKSRVKVTVVTATVAGAAFRHGAYTMRTGEPYKLIAYGKKRPRYLNAAVFPNPPAGLGGRFHKVGDHRWKLRVTFKTLPGRHRYWNIGVKTGQQVQVLKIDLRGR
ncbi:MAG TPA: Ig-like domain-containing protein, partial [Candidatus Nanopelagicales bacterium]|nr:Ig-like domain-containing protein [Candidatus Nanopelagicales bacterium]